jgi:molybdopterin molybdotransferase
MTGKLIDDCFLTDSKRLTHAEAISLLKGRVAGTVATEMLAIDAAAGRVLAESIAADVPVPAHRNAAVDGYAFAAADLAASRDGVLAVRGRAAAGHPLSDAASSGAAVRIFTGAVMPEGTDTVVMQEDVRLVEGAGEGRVAIPRGLKAGANQRLAGEDLKAGETIFPAGHKLRPQDLAALASIGRSRVLCYQPLRVAVVSTGDEVIVPGARALRPGEVYDANAPMLAAMVERLGGVVSRLGVIEDRADAVKEALANAARTHHLVLTSGGASRGEEDHMAAAIDALGRRHMWQIAVKPGRPMMLGQIGDCVVVGLPGNPVAVFVCFLMYVRPLMSRLAGAPFVEPRRYKLPARFAFTGRKTGRREFWRGLLVDTPAGLAVDKFQRDGSGLISGLRAADGLIDIPEAHGDVSPGDLVDFIPFSELGISV